MSKRVVHRNDVRMIEPGTGQRLAAEAFNSGLIARDVAFQHLDGDLAIKECVMPQPDLGHSAASNVAVELVSVADEPWFELNSRHD